MKSRNIKLPSAVFLWNLVSLSFPPWPTDKMGLGLDPCVHGWGVSWPPWCIFWGTSVLMLPWLCRVSVLCWALLSPCCCLRQPTSLCRTPSKTWRETSSGWTLHILQCITVFSWQSAAFPLTQFNLEVIYLMKSAGCVESWIFRTIKKHLYKVLFHLFFNSIFI